MNDTALSAGGTPGEQLQAAREQAGLSVERVAKDLFLDVQKIRAMELNHFKDLGAPVYAKGYLKKYARLVGLTEEDLLRRYDALSDAPAVPTPVPVTLGMIPESRKPLPRWIRWVVAALIVLAGAVTLLNLRGAGTEAGKQGQLISQPLSSPGAVVVAGQPSGTETIITIPAEGPTLSLSFKFSGDSWVEVYDARNQQILYDMGTAHTSRQLVGTPPLRVVLGAATAVSLQVNSQEVIIPSTHIESGVARFVLNADGALE